MVSFPTYRDYTKKEDIPEMLSSLIDSRIEKLCYESGIDKKSFWTNKAENSVSSEKARLISMDVADLKSITSSIEFKKAMAEIEMIMWEARCDYAIKLSRARVTSFFAASTAFCKETLIYRGITEDLDRMLKPFCNLYEFLIQEFVVDYSKQLPAWEREGLCDKICRRVERLASFYMDKILEDTEIHKSIGSIETTNNRLNEITKEYIDSKAKEVMGSINKKVRHYFYNIKNNKDLSDDSKKKYASLLNKEVINLGCEAMARSYLYKMAGVDSPLEEVLSGIDDIVYKYDAMFPSP